MAVRINGYLIDAALSETHSYPSVVTEFPVEEGSNLTDNIRHGPIEVTIDGIVSDTPIGATALVRASETAEAGEDLEMLPSEEALARLERIRDRRQPVTIQTSKRVYERMAMEMLEVPVDPTTGKALRFSARFRQITTATNLRTVIRTATPGGRGKQRLGHRALLAARAANGRLVWTIKSTAILSPSFVKGSRDAETLVLHDEARGRDHYSADKPGYIADGYVARGRYVPFRRPFSLPNEGGAMVQDLTSGEVWHDYTFRDQAELDQQFDDAFGGTDETDPLRRWRGAYE